MKKYKCVIPICNAEPGATVRHQDALLSDAKTIALGTDMSELNNFLYTLNIKEPDIGVPV